MYSILSFSKHSSIFFISLFIISFSSIRGVLFYPLMNFIQGQALLRSKCKSPSIYFIYKMEIVNYSEMILEGDHILTNDLGEIIIFNCKKGSKEFKGIIKYWSSKMWEDNTDYLSKREDYLDFELKEDKGDKDLIYILINGIYYLILSKPSSKPIISIYFQKGYLTKGYYKGNDRGDDTPKVVKEEDALNITPKDKDAFKDSLKNTPLISLKDTNHPPSNIIPNHPPLEILIPSPFIDFIIPNLPSSCSLHSSLSYFCFSNFKTYFGFIFNYFLEGYHYYSILLLSKFYNPIEIINLNNINLNINNINLINNLNIPYFIPNNCFMIINNNKELYFSNFINLNFNFPLDFLDKVIGSILNEERICFISKKDLLLKIMYFLKYIEPFKWSHSLIISKSKEKDLIESPLPFIYGVVNEGGDRGVDGSKGKEDRGKEDGGKDSEGGIIKEGGKEEKFNPSLLNPSLNYILIDLDSFTITNPPSPTYPYTPSPLFTQDFTLNFSHFLDFKKKFILEKYPDLIQDFLFYSHKYFLNLNDLNFSFFLKRFTSTRMFSRYLVEERFTPINYIYDIHFNKIEIIPFKNILDYKIEEVIEGFIMIYDIKNEEISKKVINEYYYKGKGDYYKGKGDYDFNNNDLNDNKGKGDNNHNDIINNNHINNLHPIFRRLSIQKDFKSISNLIKRKPLTLKESQKINIYEEQRDFKIKEKDYEGMYFVNVCDYDDKGFKEGKGEGDVKGGGNGDYYHYYKDINKDNKLSFIHSPLNHNKDICKFKTLIFINEMVFDLYPLSSLITVFLNLPKNEDLEKYPEIFYNLVGYFYYFDLPFNTEEVDYVM